MTTSNSVLLYGLSRAPLVQVNQRLQQVVQAGVPALLLHPNAQQLVDLVFIQKALFALYYVVVDPQVTEESLVVVEIDVDKILEAFLQRIFTCEKQNKEVQ